MSFCLLTQAWIPIRRASGGTQLMRPCDITDDLAGDPIVALNWPRPDFQQASLEFLIGLLATAWPPPDNENGWRSRWIRPPTPDTLQNAFLPFASAFDLDGAGPRFMQDFEDIDGAPSPVETLLMEAPGFLTKKKNADHFTKRDTTATMCRAAAAMALFTLQAYAPSGGAGNRVGLRGGGPLTTLAVPPWHGVLPLWHLLWANVPVGKVPTPKQMIRIFPWLTPTRTSDNGHMTTPSDVHDLQAYWGAPRRIRLAFSKNANAMPCDIMGTTDTVDVRSWTQRPNGASYALWHHPLSPYYRLKPTDTQWLPVHAQPGGVGYRHWIGFLVDDASDNPTRRPASTIQTFRQSRKRHLQDLDRNHWHMLAAGYDMDNMKARGFVESEMTIIEPAEPGQEAEFNLLLRQMIEGAAAASSLLSRAIRRALFSDGAKIPLDATMLATVRGRFWGATEPRFLQHIQKAAAPGADIEKLRRAWLADLTLTVRRLFAESAPIDAKGANRRPERLAAAGKSLNFSLTGFGKDGEAFWRKLGLALPEKAGTRKAPAKRMGQSKKAKP